MRWRRVWGPPQTLWNHGCCDSRVAGQYWSFSCRLKLFGITGAATRSVGAGRYGRRPPQTLWNHGCCDLTRVNAAWLAGLRLKLFGITGAATPNPAKRREPSPSASNSLESRVLRRVWGTRSCVTAGPPQTLWNHGCCDQKREDVRNSLLSRLKLFGITGAATKLANQEPLEDLSASNSLESRVLRQGDVLHVGRIVEAASNSLESRVLRRDSRACFPALYAPASNSLESRVLRPA